MKQLIIFLFELKLSNIGENMDFQKNRGMIILIVALILAAILTFYVGVKNPIILGLGILAIIVIAILLTLILFI